MKHIDIALLTCQPHDEVYSLYGHTAIRMRNSLTHQDLAINYGVFDPTAGLFVLRFVFGLTDYSMGVCKYKDFLDEYRYFGSGVYEQHLNLAPEEKAKFLSDILENSKPENLVYRYNYFYNNCTTRARDIIMNSFDSREVYYSPLTHLQRGEVSFRQLIHNKNENYKWARLGNDLLLGCLADVNTTHNERQFLPEVLSEDFDSASIVFPDGRRKQLVDTAFWAVTPGKPWHNPDNINFPLTPLQCAWSFFCVILALMLTECYCVRLNMTSTDCKVYFWPWIHYFIYCIYAVPGLLLFLMLFSQHPTVRINLQIFIYCPLWFIFGLPKVWKKWGRRVMLFCVIAFFLGNFIQNYAEGTNIMALALLTTFCPYYFDMSKKSCNFAQ